MNVHLIGSGFSIQLGYPTGLDYWAEIRKSLDARGSTADPMDEADIIAGEVVRVAQREGRRPTDLLGNAWAGTIRWFESQRAGVLGSLLTSEPDMEMLLTQMLIASGLVNPLIAEQLGLERFLPSDAERAQRGEQLAWAVHVIETGLNLYFLQRHSAERYETNGGAALVRRWIDQCVAPGDVILTTNYDLVLEHFLWDATRWSPNDGYSMPFSVVDEIATIMPELSQGAELNKPSDIRLLKLHGSAGWYLNTATGEAFAGMDLLSGIGILGRDHGGLPWEFEYERSVVVQPGYLKGYLIGAHLTRLWNQAAVALESAERLYVIGYSFPPPDQAIRALLSKSLCSTARVSVVDPSSVPVDRLKEFLTSPIDHVHRPFAEWAADSCRD